MKKYKTLSSLSLGFVFLILFFIFLPNLSLNAKDLIIHGVNFEKKYDNVFSKLYFHFFIKEKSAQLIDIAYIKNSDFIMCLSANIDWEKEICDEYSAAIADHQYFQEQRWFNSQIKPYVISSSDKNFNDPKITVSIDDKEYDKFLEMAEKI